MTKFSRTRNNGRQGILSDRILDALGRSPAWLFRFCFHVFLCVAALTLGFQLSRESFLTTAPFKYHVALFSTSSGDLHAISQGAEPSLPKIENDEPNSTLPASPVPPSSSVGMKSSRVHVGRHEILIRPWPHPDPVQIIAAHRLIESVQEEQRQSYGVKERKPVIVMTTTYVHTFQAVYMTCLIHTLRIAPGPLIWIVIEAGGVSNDTAALLSSSQLAHHHLAVEKAMPADREQRQKLKLQMRVEGLRFVRMQRLDGVMLFLDENYAYSLDFFDEAQKVKWMGAFTVGILPDSALSGASREFRKFNEFIEHPSEFPTDLKHEDESGKIKQNVSRFWPPVQGPVCNSNGYVVGWYFVKESAKSIELENDLDWAAFAFNSRIIWKDYEKPGWVKGWIEDFGLENSSIQSPISLLRNVSYIEALGNCGRDVLLWQLQGTRYLDDEFPSRWIIDPPLDVIVPSRRTPWPIAEVRDFASPIVLQSPSNITDSHTKRKSKGTKSGKGKRNSRRTKRVNAKVDANQAP